MNGFAPDWQAGASARSAARAVAGRNRTGRSRRADRDVDLTNRAPHLPTGPTSLKKTGYAATDIRRPCAERITFAIATPGSQPERDGAVQMLLRGFARGPQPSLWICLNAKPAEMNTTRRCKSPSPESRTGSTRLNAPSTRSRRLAPTAVVR